MDQWKSILKLKIITSCCIVWWGLMNVATAQISVTFSTNQPSCNGYTDGSVEAMPTGGEMPYNIVWENGTVGATLSGLGAGTYEVTVTDDTGTQEIATVMLAEPAEVVANIRNSGDVCSGTASSLVAEVNGGTTPYTYQWSNGDTGVQSDNLVAGNTTLTVTDVNGCMVVTTMQVSEAFIVETEAFDVLCTDYCDGVVKLDLRGGTAPYAIEWSTGALNQAQIDLLPPGTYGVTVTDANGCTEISTAVVGEPDAINLNLDVANVCDAAIPNVSASVTPTGGAAPYQIIWSNGTTGAITNNLARGLSYSVTVTDALGCRENIDNFFIPENPELILTTTVTNTSCDNDTNGSAEVSATGGSDYTYLWSNNATSPRIENLSPGNYTVTVTAANGCSGTETIEVEEGDELLLFPTSVNASCTGISNGMANILVEGGELPYTILWEDGQTTNTAIDLAPGTYNVTATDAAGCTGTTSITVGSNTVLTADFTNQNPTCDDANDGGTMVNIAGGTAPYNYVWNTGENVEQLVGLTAGNYIVTVTDANGCMITANTNLTGEESVEPTIATAVMACEGDLLTIAFSEVSNVAGDYNWTFSNGETSNESNPNIQIQSGEVIEATLTVTNAANCSGTTTESITAQGLEIDAPTMLTACKDDLLSLEVITNGEGELIYTYSPIEAFADGTDTNMPTLTTNEIGETIISVTVTDERGCSATQEVMINITEEVAGDPEAITTNQCEGLVVDFTNENMGIEYTYDFGDASGNTATGGDVSYEFAEAGTYTVTLTPMNAEGCAAPIEKEIIVSEPNEVAFSTETELCSEDGEITFTNESTINDDNAMYEWIVGEDMTSDESEPTFTVEESGTVEATLTVSFGEDCQLSKDTTFEVIIFDPTTADLSDVMACRGEAVELNEDANPDLTYNFEDDGTLIDGDTNNPSVMISEEDEEDKTYNVTITDATGQCEITDMVNVTLPPRIVTEVSDDVKQCGDDIVALEASSNQAETITWFENGDSLGMGGMYELSPMERETQFRLVFRDEFGCEVEETITVRNENPQVEIAPPTKNCGGGAETELVVDNLIETDMLSYSWSPDEEELIDDPTAPNPLVTPTETTTFVATIRNQLGCTIEEEVSVEVSTIDGIEANTARDTILAGESVQVEVNRNGDLIYEWTPTIGVSDPNAADPILTPETTTTYTVTVSDPNNPDCTTERELTVTVLQSNCTEGFIYLPNAFTPNGDGRNDVLFVRGFSITDLRLIIYNRWGEKVFESNSLDSGWDGTFNGEPVCSDVYGYYLEVNCFGGERFIDQGNVTVLK